MTHSISDKASGNPRRMPRVRVSQIFRIDWSRLIAKIIKASHRWSNNLTISLAINQKKKKRSVPVM